LGGPDARAVARRVDARLDSPLGGLYLWEDGRPVSMAGCGGPTPNGVRVAPVYTPPQHRGRGYASACVAALSQLLPDSGRPLCLLVLLAACAAPAPTPTERRPPDQPASAATPTKPASPPTAVPAPTGAPTPFAQPAATPAASLASSVLVLQWPGTQGRRELRP